MMINSSRRRSLILSSREDEERKKASACGASARASDAFWKRLSAEKKFLLFLWKKVEKKKFFVSLPSLINTPLRGNRREATTHQRHNKTMSAVKKLIPLMDRVLVERAVAATKTSGGILLPETVGSKVRRMNSHSHSSSLSSLVFFLWISILVYRLLGWERERALHIGRTFSLRAETEDDDGRVFFFLWWVELSLFCAWLTIGWCFSLSFLFY